MVLEKPGIKPVTPGLQGIALIHYTMAASFNIRAEIRPAKNYLCLNSLNIPQLNVNFILKKILYSLTL